MMTVISNNIATASTEDVSYEETAGERCVARIKCCIYYHLHKVELSFCGQLSRKRCNGQYKSGIICPRYPFYEVNGVKIFNGLFNRVVKLYLGTRRIHSQKNRSPEVGI